MFCPKCGKADQSPEGFCRQCGNYLPDFDQIKAKEVSPEDHLRANSFLNLLTAVVSLSLAIALYVMFLGRDDTPFIIYLTAGFLTAIFAWQVQTFWRTILLKKHFRRMKPETIERAADEMQKLSLLSNPTRELLNDADFENFVPATVTERTTKNLAEKRRKLS